MSTLTEDEALAIVWGDHITRQEISQHRWYTREIVVFRHEGAMMGFYYNDPATELQEGADVFDAIPVPIFRVTSHEVVTTVYEAADA